MQLIGKNVCVLHSPSLSLDQDQDWLVWMSVVVVLALSLMTGLKSNVKCI